MTNTRTRSRVSPVYSDEDKTCLTTTYTGTSISGFTDCAPPRVKKTSTSSISGLPTSLYDSSVITDVIVKGFGVKPCTHVKVRPYRFPKVRYVNNGLWVRVAPYVNQWFCSVGETNVSAYPGIYAWNSQLRAKAMLNPEDPAVASHLAGKVAAPASRLGEIPAALIAKIEAFHATTFALESRELPELFRQFASRKGITRGVVDLLTKRVGLLHDKKSLKKFISEANRLHREGVLATTFGLLPTVRDVRNLTKELSRASGMFSRNKVITVAKRSVDSYHGTAYCTPNGFVHGSGVMVESGAVTRIDGGRCVYHRPPCTSDSYEKLSAMMDRLVGVNPVGLAWEVLPYSFMFDWLLAIDDILDSLWLNSQSRFDVSYWTTVKRSHRGSIHLNYCNGVEAVWPQSFKPQYGAAMDVDCDITSYQRSLTDAPSISNVMRAKGANLRNIYLGLLIALGFRKKK